MTSSTIGYESGRYDPNTVNEPVAFIPPAESESAALTPEARCLLSRQAAAVIRARSSKSWTKRRCPRATPGTRFRLSLFPEAFW